MSPERLATNWLDVASALRQYAAWMSEHGRVEWGDFAHKDAAYAAGLAQRLESAPGLAAHLTREDATYLTGSRLTCGR